VRAIGFVLIIEDVHLNRVAVQPTANSWLPLRRVARRAANPCRRAAVEPVIGPTAAMWNPGLEPLPQRDHKIAKRVKATPPRLESAVSTFYRVYNSKMTILQKTETKVSKACPL